MNFSISASGSRKVSPRVRELGLIEQLAGESWEGNFQSRNNRWRGSRAQDSAQDNQGTTVGTA